MKKVINYAELSEENKSEVLQLLLRSQTLSSEQCTPRVPLQPTKMNHNLLKISKDSINGKAKNI